MNFQALFDASPNPYLVLDRRLHIAGANRAYLASVKRELPDIVGRWAWDAFPADPETVRQAVASFERVIRTKQTDIMALLRFDVPRPALEGGGFMERYWSITHSPVLGADGEVEFVLQHPIDVTELRHLQEAVEQAGIASAAITPEQCGIFSRARSVSESNLALKAESDRLNEMFAQAPSFMVLLRGREHRIEGANPAYLRLVGHRPLVGKTVAEALPDAVEQGYLDLLDRVFDSGEAYVATGAAYAVQAGPGSPVDQRFVDFVYQPLKDGAGRVRGIFVEGTDVTDRMAGQAALRESEARNRQILDSAIDYAIVATDLDGRVTRWNEGARRILGWTEEEMLGQGAERFFTPEDVVAGQVQKEMRAALGAGRGIDERWHQRKGGERFWTSGEMTALKDEAGTVIGFVKVLRDRTAERQRVQRLQLLSRASEGLLGAERPDDVLHAVLDASAELIDFDQSHSYTVTPDGRHLQLTHSSGVSAEAQKALQCASFDGPLCGIVAETKRPLILEHLQASTEPRHEPDRAAGLNAFAGYPICVRDRLFGVISFGSFTRASFDPETLSYLATLAHYVSVVRERVNREVDLRELNATLERRVEERSRELMAAEERLRQSQKMEAVGQLTGGLAHDFNNLLTGIAGSLELLQARMAQGRLAGLDRYVNAAQGAAKRAAALTHRLLAFSRRQTLDPKPTDMNRLVAGMEELVRRTVGPEIAVEMVGADGLCATLVDPSQLESALLNLCINARDAMPDGGRITIETANTWLDERAARERDLPPGQYVSLCVGDNGTGMTPEVVARAFDPFFTTKPIGMGTGLGLSMIYGFAQQSGGQARIRSEVGQGTTVCLYLPRYLGVAEEVEASAGLADAPRAGRGETVLVVDDEPTVRMLVAEVLEDLGYAAIEAADGAAGLKVLQSDARIDLLVTDVGLPGGMNGRQVADAARVARPSLEVLFITGYAENAVLGHGHLEPGMHVLAKPFAMEALASRIKELTAER